MSIFKKLFSDNNANITKGQVDRQFAQLFMNLTNISTSIQNSDNKQELVTKGYVQNSTVFSIVNYIINAASIVPIKVYRVDDNSALKDYRSLTTGNQNETTMIKAAIARDRAMKPAMDSDLQKLLDNPNPDMGYAQWFSEVMGFLQITGDTYIQKVSPTSGVNAGKAKSLYALPAHLMEIVISGNYSKMIQGYRLIIDQWKRELPYEDVAHVKTFNPEFSMDGRHLYGQSPLTAAYRNLAINNDAIDTGSNFLKNQGVRGILASDDMGMLDEAQAKALQKRYEQKYGGSSEAGKIMITNHMFKWINMGLPAADVALIEQYDLSKKDIAAAYNFPYLLLGNIEDFNNSNYREAKKQMYLQKVLPDLRLIRDELNRWLTPSYSTGGNQYYIDFDFSVIPELQEDLEKVTKQLNVSWWLTPNEKRLAQGYDKSEDQGMDNIYIPANQISMADEALAGELEGGNPIQRISE